MIQYVAQSGLFIPSAAQICNRRAVGESDRCGKRRILVAKGFILKKAVEAWYRPILGGIFASRL